MTERKHPLTANPRWKFTQPDIGFHAYYTAVDRVSGEKEVIGLETSNTCREGIISNARSGFQQRLTNLAEIREYRRNGNWSIERPELKPLRDCDLAEHDGKERLAQLKLQWHPIWMKDCASFPVEKFLRVCDVVLGPIAVLLSPWRPKGANWWRTDPEEASHTRNENRYVYWQGSDNWFLAHPATMAIATGLYRQCFHLCIAGVADEVIDTLSEKEVAEVMSTNSQKLALQFIKRTRPWIEVPVAEYGYTINYAFPFGVWRRLICLQRAIRRHGYEKSLGQSFHEGWATVEGEDWLGAYGFWGEEEELTDYHRHLMKMGARRRKTRGKSAPKSS